MRSLAIGWAMFFALGARAATIPDGLYDGQSLAPVTLTNLIDKVHSGQIVVLGEVHDAKAHQQNQIAIIQAMIQRGFTVSVGMEFFAFTAQASIDKYMRGKLSEKDFLAATDWGGNDFSNYRVQVNASQLAGGTTLGLNAPRFLTRKIYKQGMDSLTAEERALIPPAFTLGNPLYRERFDQVLNQGSGHGQKMDPETLDKMFVSQSLWDDTMAFVATNFIAKNPQHVLVIIVGDFHAAYGGGLPSRLAARGARDVLVVSQLRRSDYSAEELEAKLVPHIRYGSRADNVWLTP